MTTDNEAGRLLNELWLDLQQPDVLWQVGVLLTCFALARVFDGWLTDRFAGASEQRGAAAFGQHGLKRLGLPLAMLALVFAARPLLAHWQHVNLLSLAIPLLTSLVVIRAVMFVIRQSFFSAAPWLASFERVLAFFAWGVVALHILGLLPAVIAAMEQVGFNLGKQRLNLWLILQGAGVLLFTLLAALWAGGLVEARLMSAQGVDGNLKLVFSRIVRALLIVVAVLVGLPMVGIDLTMLSVFGGALGVGLGFGLQKIAANYVSGFIILIDRSIRIGNLIDIAGMRGIVTRITTRYTLLRGMTGVEMIVPNEMLVGSVITNETFTDPKVRIAVPMQVGYGSDIEQAMELLVVAAQAQPRVLIDPPPRATISAFADSGINLELGFWIDDPEEGTGQVRSDILLAVWKSFKTAGIEIPFPQREVRMLGQ